MLGGGAAAAGSTACTDLPVLRTDSPERAVASFLGCSTACCFRSACNRVLLSLSWPMHYAAVAFFCLSSTKYYYAERNASMRMPLSTSCKCNPSRNKPTVVKIHDPALAHSHSLIVNFSSTRGGRRPDLLRMQNPSGQWVVLVIANQLSRFQQYLWHGRSHWSVTFVDVLHVRQAGSPGWLNTSRVAPSLLYVFRRHEKIRRRRFYV